MKYLLFSAVFFAFSCIMIGVKPWSGEKAIGPYDLLITRPLYTPEGVLPGRPRFGERSDYLDAYRSRWRYFREHARSGDWEKLFSIPHRGFGEKGIQLLSNNFWTFRTQLYIWMDDPLVGHNMGHLVQLTFGALGAFALLLALGFLVPWAYLGAFAFGWNGFISSWLYWSQFTTATWIPWVLWALLTLHRKPTIKTALVFSLSVAGLISGGFPAVAAYTLGFALLATIVNSVKTFSWKGLAYFVLGLGVALVAMSPFIYQFYAMLSEVDTSYRRGMRGVPIKHLARYVLPLKWVPRVEYTGYVGLLPLVGMLALVVLPRGRKMLWQALPTSKSVLEGPLFWSVSSLLFVIAAFDYPKFLSNIAYSLPIIGTNPSGRMMSVIALTFVVCGVWGLQALWKTLKHRSWAPKSAFVAAAGLLFIHTVDVVRLWRKQNTRRPRVEFVAESPALKKLIEERSFGDVALADTSVAFFPGTLTAYGLKEWHAHGFKTPDQKERLALLTPGKSPWVTPTNAILKAEDFPPLDSPVYNDFDIKFLVLPEKFQPRSPLWEELYKGESVLILKRKVSVKKAEALHSG